MTLKEKIAEIFYPYVGINSKTGTALENETGAFVHAYFAKVPYFIQHPEYFGSYSIQGDPFNRTVEWAFVRGKGRRTVVLMHHFDVVDIEDYGLLKPLAFTPAELEQAMLNNIDAYDAETRADLLSGEYIFGRGTMDMKGGGAIEIALLEMLSQENDLDGNVLLVGVPDEENLSAGMLGAARLMADLKKRFDLDYVLLINTEPGMHEGEVRSMPAGGIGKVFPFLYARGVLAHASHSYKGFNPLWIVGDVVRRAEMNLAPPELRSATGEATPPPTWLMVRDSKEIYDVSMPLSGFACLNVFTYVNRPEVVLNAFREVCAASTADVLADANRITDDFHRKAGLTPREQPWMTAAITFEEFIAQQKAARGKAFEDVYHAALEKANAAVRSGEKTTAAATWALLDTLAPLADVYQPLVIVGLIPPYYPSVVYTDRPDFTVTVTRVLKTVNGAAQGKFGEKFELENYMGISDLSYTSLNDASGVEQLISRNMPLYGETYNIPFREIGEISMPCVNIGPVGKGVHKMTERVLKEDLFVKTPEFVLAALHEALKEG